MKIKVLLIAAACSMGALGAYAQKGVDNGTQFGSGEDSIRCITNISLFLMLRQGILRMHMIFGKLFTMNVLLQQRIFICMV